MKYETALIFTDTVAPAKAFTECQECESKDVFEFDGDLFCNPCGWNSIEHRVESQLSSQIAKHRKQSKQSKSCVATQPNKTSKPKYNPSIVARVRTTETRK